MSFAAGESIEVLEKQEEWWRGRLSDGSNGWFPKNYVATTPVQIAPKKKAPSRPAPAGPPAATAAAPVASPGKTSFVFSFVNLNFKQAKVLFSSPRTTSKDKRRAI